MSRRRRRAHKRAFDWKRLPRFVLVGGALGLVGWLSVQSAAVDAWSRRNPLAAARFAPDNPQVALGRAMLEFRQQQGAIEPATADRALRSLQDAPLAEEPFLIAGLLAITREQSRAAEPLLVEARRRNPRSRIARLLLLDNLLRTGRVEEAVAEIAAVRRLVPSVGRVLIPELARYAANPATSGALVQAVRRDPELQTGLLDHLAVQQADPALIMKFAPARLVYPADERPAWQANLLRNLVESGRIGQARTLWARFAGAPEAAAGVTVYDPDFRGLPGPPPFNWSFPQSAAGAADPTRDQALQVEYYGRQNAELASQLLTLGPGRHTIAFQATGSTPGGRSAMSWSLTCQPAGAEVMTFPIPKLSYQPARLKAQFVVPASGCPAQMLRLVGTPAEFPAAQSLTVRGLSIARTGI